MHLHELIRKKKKLKDFGGGTYLSCKILVILTSKITRNWKFYSQYVGLFLSDDLYWTKLSAGKVLLGGGRSIFNCENAVFFELRDCLVGKFIKTDPITKLWGKDIPVTFKGELPEWKNSVLIAKWKRGRLGLKRTGSVEFPDEEEEDKSQHMKRSIWRIAKWSFTGKNEDSGFEKIVLGGQSFYQPVLNTSAQSPPELLLSSVWSSTTMDLYAQNMFK